MDPRLSGILCAAAEYARHLEHDDGLPHAEAIARAKQAALRCARKLGIPVALKPEEKGRQTPSALPAALVGTGTVLSVYGSGQVGALLTGLGWVVSLTRR